MEMDGYLSTVLGAAEGVAHLKRCVHRALKTELLEDPFTEEDASLLLQKFGCREFLGGGTFGAVFELACGTKVAKIVPQRPGTSRASPHSCMSEFYMQQKFAALDLALAPHRYHSFSLRGCELELGIIVMPKFSLTLEKRLHAKQTLSFKEAKRLSRSIVRLFRIARAHCLSHNDLKCNNLCVDRKETVYFSDFGKSFDETFLRSKKSPQESLSKILDLSAAIDAWRLQASIRRCFHRREDTEEREALLSVLVTPLKALAQHFLEKHGVLEAGSELDSEWWSEDAILQELKKEMAGCFERRRKRACQEGTGEQSVRGEASDGRGLADEGRQRRAYPLREGEVAPGRGGLRVV